VVLLRQAHDIVDAALQAVHGIHDATLRSRRTRHLHPQRSGDHLRRLHPEGRYKIDLAFSTVRIAIDDVTGHARRVVHRREHRTPVDPMCELGDLGTSPVEVHVLAGVGHVRHQLGHTSLTHVVIDPHVDRLASHQDDSLSQVTEAFEERPRIRGGHRRVRHQEARRVYDGGSFEASSCSDARAARKGGEDRLWPVEET
jgi:hypothetical protein